MPQPLWRAAAALARAHGTHFVARTLHLRYDSLRTRVAAGGSEPLAPSASAASFVELPMPSSFSSPPVNGPLVELVGADGARVSIRLAAGAELDALGLSLAFWGRQL